MSLSKVEFATLLKAKLNETQDLVLLSRWAYEIFLKYQKGLDVELREILLDLSRMEDSPEFEFAIDDLELLVSKLARKLG